MKSKIKSGIKIYLFLIIYVLLCCFIYSFYLTNTMTNNSKLIELLIGGTTFLLIGLVYANSIHKKGLLVGLATGIIHYLLIRVIYYLSTGIFSYNILTMLIFVLLSTIGGILGILFKKIF